MKKDEIRRQSRARKSILSEMERQVASVDVFNQLEQMAAFMMADNILIYRSLPDELSTIDFINKWHKQKQLYLPRVNGSNLDILPYAPTQLKTGAFKIEEPIGSDTTDISKIELIIVPAMAFDKQGNRVGRGKGFYDRLLADSRVLKIGVAYDCQIFDNIDVDPFDQPVDIVITQSRTYNRQHKHTPAQ